jgi:quercetin 2,3-dioxygenase
MASVSRLIGGVWAGKPTVDGAGVRLNRIFSHDETGFMDPFLLLDDFHSKNPDDYLAGFPWHPHRGIETVTYIIRGEVAHGDSMGNRGAIRSGDMQWMTAGSGIIHQEMPKRYEGMMQGFQLWVNLPKTHKMMAPRYRDIAKETIPEVSTAEGATVKVISGRLGGKRGPIKDLVADISYLDVIMEPLSGTELKTKRGHTAFAYVFEGSATFGLDGGETPAGSIALFKGGGDVKAASGKNGARYLFVSGKPLHEPIAWRGPIVMNTQEELDRAYAEYAEGTFIKEGRGR